eukprot:TRINITY_DN3254_c0_g1_i1.p1 TRINITY_DN3254_c0_g1~~TRINITY_DN3254_c0_g1_i1.p1  ORF type:complete len:719 (+),score=182.71 TRINITY_DN3254_c0_g1_i1:57-2213(+)
MAYRTAQEELLQIRRSVEQRLVQADIRGGARPPPCAPAAAPSGAERERPRPAHGAGPVATDGFNDFLKRCASQGRAADPPQTSPPPEPPAHVPLPATTHTVHTHSSSMGTAAFLTRPPTLKPSERERPTASASMYERFERLSRTQSVGQPSTGGETPPLPCSHLPRGGRAVSPFPERRCEPPPAPEPAPQAFQRCGTAPPAALRDDPAGVPTAAAAAADEALVKCRHCSRTFHAERIAKHEGVCVKGRTLHGTATPRGGGGEWSSTQRERAEAERKYLDRVRRRQATTAAAAAPPPHQQQQPLRSASSGKRAQDAAAPREVPQRAASAAAARRGVSPATQRAPSARRESEAHAQRAPSPQPCFRSGSAGRGRAAWSAHQTQPLAATPTRSKSAREVRSKSAREVEVRKASAPASAASTPQRSPATPRIVGGRAPGSAAKAALPGQAPPVQRELEAQMSAAAVGAERAGARPRSTRLEEARRRKKEEVRLGEATAATRDTVLRYQMLQELEESLCTPRRDRRSASQSPSGVAARLQSRDRSAARRPAAPHTDPPRQPTMTERDVNCAHHHPLPAAKAACDRAPVDHTPDRGSDLARRGTPSTRGSGTRESGFEYVSPSAVRAVVKSRGVAPSPGGVGGTTGATPTVSVHLCEEPDAARGCKRPVGQAIVASPSPPPQSAESDVDKVARARACIDELRRLGFSDAAAIVERANLGTFEGC